MLISRRLHGTDSRERGGVLVLSLVAVLTVSVLAAGFSRFASSVASRQAHAVNRKRAFYLAEAGLAESFAAFTCGRSGVVGTVEQPARLGDGLFWVEATELEPGIVRLLSTGMAGTGRAELALIVQRGEKDVTSLGVFSDGDVALAAGSLVDAYDSSAGDYESQTDRSGASLGSNGAVTITGSTESESLIDGDVIAGPDLEVVADGQVTITGTAGSALTTTVLPQVDTPEIKLDPAQNQDSPYPLVIPPGTVGYEGLTVAAGSQVIIQGPAVVVLGSLTLKSEAELFFDTTQGEVTLYVTDALDLVSGSFLSTSGTAPEDVLIQVPGETLTPLSLRSNAAFHGSFYAPQATVEVGTGFEVFGALVAGTLAFDGPAKLHFDLHLAELAADSSLPKVMTWRLEELSNPTADLGLDPYQILGVSRGTLVPPRQALQDQLLDIHYYDASDVYHRYTGPESSFDWTVVKTVISATLDGVEMNFPSSGTTKSGATKSPGVLPVIDGPMI